MSKTNYLIKFSLLCTTLLLISYYIYNNNYKLDFLSITLLLSLYFVIFLSSVFELYKIKTENYLPIVILTNIYFFSCYLFLFFLDKKKIYPRYSEADYLIGLKTFFYGYICFLIGGFLSYFIFKNFDRKGFKSLEANDNEFFIIGCFLLFINLFFYEVFNINEYISGLSQIKYVIIPMGIGFLVKYIIDCEKNKKTILKRLISKIFISYTLFLFILNGALSYPFMFGFLIFVYFSFRKKKIYILPFVFITIAFLFFHLGKYEYRNDLGKNIGKSEWYKIISLFKVQNYIYKNKNDLQRETSCFSLDEKDIDNHLLIEKNLDCKQIINPQLERRIFHSMESLLRVTTMSPKIVPYWDGYSYLYLKTKLIPRIFWKNKPSDELGNEFGHRYKKLTPEIKEKKQKKDISTSWNMPVLNELYVNYGNKGVIYGMFIIGLIFNLIAKTFNVSSDRNMENLISFFIFVPIFFLESHASLVFGAIIQSYIFAMILSFILLKIIRKLN
jgi:hypothetical protein